MKTWIRLAVLAASMLLLFSLAGALAAASPALELPLDLKIVDARAFYGDQSIKSVVLPEGLREIRAEAFANTSITSIDLPKSLTFIADNAFTGTRLTTVTAVKGSYAWTWAEAKGYAVTACAHTTLRAVVESATRFFEWDEALMYDERYHETRVTEQHVANYCSKCGKFMGRGIVVKREEDSYLFFHSFDETGACEICDFVCTHPAANRVQETYANTSTKRTVAQLSGNNVNHKVTYAGCYQESRCGICNLRFAGPTKVGKAYSEEEAHSYNTYGKCTVCGYTNKCKHENVWYDGEGEHFIRPVNAAYHVYTGSAFWSDTGYSFWCLDCENAIDYRTDRIVPNGGWIEADGDFYTEPHRFVNGICALCGYHDASTAASARIDLTGYLNTDIVKTAQLFGATSEYSAYYSSLLHMRTDDYQETGKVAVIGIDKTNSAYSIAGVTLGMTKSEAEQKLKANGWTRFYDYNDEEDDGLYYKNAAGWELVIVVNGASGTSKVTYVAVVTWAGAWS